MKRDMPPDKKSTTAIIQARMTSTRLPGKVLKTVQGKTLLEYLLERVSRAKSIDRIVVATTTNSTDDPIATLCRERQILCFRGSEDNVLSRYHFAAQKFGGETLVRLTSDCPLMDPHVVDEVVQYYQNHDYDFVTNSPDDNHPRTIPRGMDVEVFSKDLLRQAFEESKTTTEREHVTPFFRVRPDRFRVKYHEHANPGKDLRLTVDTPEDFELIQKIIQTLSPDKPAFGLNDIYELIDKRSDLAQINRHVMQKKH